MKGTTFYYYSRYSICGFAFPGKMLLSKLSSVDLENTILNIIVFHTALFQILQQWAMIMEFTGLTTFPTILKWQA